jgi:hypothetical protein
MLKLSYLLLSAALALILIAPFNRDDSDDPEFEGCELDCESSYRSEPREVVVNGQTLLVFDQESLLDKVCRFDKDMAGLAAAVAGISSDPHPDCLPTRGFFRKPVSYSYVICEREDPGQCTYLRTSILEWRRHITSKMCGPVPC